MKIVLPDSFLYDAVFGGPRPTKADVAQWITEAKLTVPSLVVALPYGESVTPAIIAERLRKAGAVPAAGGRRRAIHLSPAGSFWFLPLEKVPDDRRLCLDRPEQLIGVMQAAILEQRRRDLETLDQTASGLFSRSRAGDLLDLSEESLRSNAPRSFTHQEEREAFAMALQEALRGGTGEALPIWSRIVLHRHHGQINAVRLRWVEFLTGLTRGSEANVAYISYSLIRAIYREHSLPKLGQLPERIVSELVPLLAGRQAGAGEGQHPALSRVFAYMEEHFAERIGLAEVAAAVHISAAHLARLFRRETGQTIVSTLQRLRIQRACELLATTDKPLLEVAYDSGFESVEHFHRLFRRQCGVTPRLYRLTHR